VTDRARHDEKASDEIDANDQGPDERDPVDLMTDWFRRGLLRPVQLTRYSVIPPSRF
jgi:hypothetical protein